MLNSVFFLPCAVIIFPMFYQLVASNYEFIGPIYREVEKGYRGTD